MRPAVILVHGLSLWRDPRLQWMAQCAAEIRAAGGTPICFGYARRAAWAGFFRPTGGTAVQLVRRFVATYDRVRARHGPPSVIAHSFGTYLVTRALSDFERLQLDALILFGSIVSEAYDWAAVVARGQLSLARIRNEVGTHTAALRLAAGLRRFGYPYGASGLTGFRLEGSLNARYAGPSLGDAGFGRYCREVWVPALGLSRPTRRAAGRPVRGLEVLATAGRSLQHARRRRRLGRGHTGGAVLPATGASVGVPARQTIAPHRRATPRAPRPV